MAARSVILKEDWYQLIWHIQNLTLGLQCIYCCHCDIIVRRQEHFKATVYMFLILAQKKADNRWWKSMKILVISHCHILTLIVYLCLDLPLEHTCYIEAENVLDHHCHLPHSCDCTEHVQHCFECGLTDFPSMIVMTWVLSMCCWWAVLELAIPFPSAALAIAICSDTHAD